MFLSIVEILRRPQKLERNINIISIFLAVAGLIFDEKKIDIYGKRYQKWVNSYLSGTCHSTRSLPKNVWEVTIVNNEMKLSVLPELFMKLELIMLLQLLSGLVNVLFL